MSRWIDADALRKDIARLHVLNDESEIRRAYNINPHASMTDFEETLVDVFDAIDDAPSIDIVRCKECKHAHMTYGGDCKYCDMWKDDDDGCIELYLDGDFYCSYGERKESE